MGGNCQESGSWWFLSTAEVSGEKQDEEDEQDEAETASSDQWPTEVKSAAAEQEHQCNEDNK